MPGRLQVQDTTEACLNNIQTADAEREYVALESERGCGPCGSLDVEANNWSEHPFATIGTFVDCAQHA